ncbi:hypothetical protein Tco_0144273 [Tanacetum coccineum]
MVNLIVKKSSGTTSEKQTDNSRSGSDTNAGDEKISKDASEIDINVDESFYDKDNITEVQSSNNEMLKNVFAHDHDQQHTAANIKTDHTMLKEENGLLKKEIEAYKERV